MIKFNLIGDSDLGFNLQKTLKKIVWAIRKKQRIRTSHVFSIILINNDEIKQINNHYRRLDKITDVLTFANYDEANKLERNVLPYELGDIFISIDQVKAQANEYGHSILREFAFLVIHGILHLFGYDHLKPEDEALMFSMQEEILQIIKIERK